MKKVFLALILLLSAILAAPATGDTFIDEQYAASRPPVEGQPGWISGYYDDGIDDGRAGSALFGIKVGPESQGWETATLCTSMTDPACTGYTQFDFNAYLPECSATVTTDCIVGITAITDKGEENGTFVRQFPEKGANDFTGNPNIGLPNGESPSLWQFENVKHAGGNQFMIMAAVTGYASPQQVDPLMKLNLYPVSIKTGMGPNTVTWNVAKLANNKFGRGARDERVYLYRGDDEVVTRWPFPADTKFKITVRVKRPLTGWLHGRVEKPDIQITTGSFGQQFAITALPTVVPTVDYWTRFTELPEELRKLLIEEGRPSGAFYFGNGSEGGWEDVTTSHQNGGPTDERTMQKFLYFVQVAKDKAAANKSSWTIRTMTPRELGSAAQCLQGKTSLAGVVSTNSTVYLSGPPTFDTATQTLNYRVAAPHYARSGDLNVGQYALVMKSDVARCVYGFKDAPYSASVSVVSANGTAQVATTSVTQKDGWLYLTAGGFTYSSPTVQVKLTQEQPAPVVVKPVAKRTTITCVKGETTKKVSGTKCPSGWKKK